MKTITKTKKQLHTELMNLVRDEIELVYAEFPDDHDKLCVFEDINFNLYARFKKLLDEYYIVDRTKGGRK